MEKAPGSFNFTRTVEENNAENLLDYSFQRAGQGAFREWAEAPWTFEGYTGRQDIKNLQEH
jgi:hypothetical protein